MICGSRRRLVEARDAIRARRGMFRRNMMTHSGMLWGAALYNNGGFPYKNTRFGESYDRDGIPQALKTIPAPTAEDDAYERNPSGVNAAVSLGNFAARKCAARI